MTSMYLALRTWRRSHWLTALAISAVAVVTVAVPTDLIDTAVFSREVPPAWWSWPALLASAVLTGLLAATYVRDTGPAEGRADLTSAGAARRSRLWGTTGGVLTFFAVGCPVCNKLVLLAIGSSGAMSYFAPVQPALAVTALALLAWALARRLRSSLTCPVRPRAGAAR